MLMNPVLRILNNETVWMILEELSKSPKTPPDLAKRFDMSIANVNNFISRLFDLEVIKKVKKIRSGRGRPFTQYAMNKNQVFIIMPSQGKKYYIENGDIAINEIKEIIKRNKGELI